MNSELYISDYSIVRNSLIWKGQDISFQSDENEFTDFIKSAYKNYSIKYPKFFKMDNLCKLALIGTEVVLKDELFKGYDRDKIGLVFMNNCSSLETDRKHQISIDDKDNYFPSPAVFVYTLANIMMGEIAIKHQFKGENACFISEKFDPELFIQYTEILFQKGKIDACLCGWVDFDNDGYESVIVAVEKIKGKNLTFDINRLQHIYKN